MAKKPCLPKWGICRWRCSNIQMDVRLCKHSVILHTPCHMMTSSNENIFRVTGPLCGEFAGHRWIPLTKAIDVELWCFLWSAPWINDWVNNREAGDLRRHRVHYDVIVMKMRHICRYKCSNIHTPYSLYSYSLSNSNTRKMSKQYTLGNRIFRSISI